MTTADTTLPVIETPLRNGEAGRLCVQRLVIGLQARDPEGQLVFAHVIEGDAKLRTERRFRWSRMGNLVTQWIWMPVSNSNGYGDGYWRTAGRRDSERVLKVINERKNEPATNNNSIR